MGLIMYRLKLAATTLFVLFLVFFLHLKGMQYHFYMTYWYYDIIMHFLAGIGIALSALYVLKNPKDIILITLVAGLAWELFEVYFNIAGSPIGSTAYRLDTLKDLFDDVLGSVLVYLLIYVPYKCSLKYKK